MQVPGLAERLTAIEAQMEVIRVLHAYCQSLDQGDQPAFVDCFTPDGVMRVRSRPPYDMNTVSSGSEQLRTLLSESRPLARFVAEAFAGQSDS